MAKPELTPLSKKIAKEVKAKYPDFHLDEEEDFELFNSITETSIKVFKEELTKY